MKPGDHDGQNDNFEQNRPAPGEMKKREALRQTLEQLLANQLRRRVVLHVYGSSASGYVRQSFFSFVTLAEIGKSY